MSEVFLPVSVTHHYALGSSCPERNSKIMRLYSMKFCPYAQRTRLVLAAKKIENEVVNINLVNRPEWYYAKNPLGKVPCLEFDGTKVLYESLVTCDYLDEFYPTRPLNNKDPFQKAQDRIFIELFSTNVLPNSYKLYRIQPEDETTWKSTLEALHDGLQVFEEELVKRGSTFFGGDAEPGMLDYMIWPWIERLPLFDVMYHGVIKVNLDKFPKLAKWFDAMRQDDAVKESYISPENHAKFIKSFIAGSPDYDMVL